MEHLSQKTSVAITAIVVALGLVASTAVNAFLMTTTTTPVYAAPSKEKVITRSDVIVARATWDHGLNPLEVPGLEGTLIDAFLRVSESKEGVTDIGVLLTIAIDNVAYCAEGFTTTDQNVFDIDNKLTSATLSPVTMDVVLFDDLDCFEATGTTQQITIQAAWEGIGDISKFTSNDHSNFEGFSLKIKGVLQVREAIAEGSINNVDLGTSQFAEFVESKSVTMLVSENIIT